MYRMYNPNPAKNRIGDCAVRAISRLFDVDWQTAYMMLAAEGLMLYEMMNDPYVIGTLLQKKGYMMESINNVCPDCTTVKDFTNEHKIGKYALFTDHHIVAVVDGDYFDSWDSGDEIVLYYFKEVQL